MFTPKQKQIMTCVKKLLNEVDKKFLSTMSARKKLVLALRNELLFMGAFTQADLDNHVYMNSLIRFLRKKRKS
ncbi:MAG: hypothetical protein NTV89_04440 [Proteobacteria bacterium]|nr:hypothetical protein [Pseudomonadota bacterium]